MVYVFTPRAANLSAHSEGKGRSLSFDLLNALSKVGDVGCESRRIRCCKGNIPFSFKAVQAS
jgi:hypothetical protein